MELLFDCAWLPASIDDRVRAVVPGARIVRAGKTDPAFADAWAGAEVFVGWPAGLDHAAAAKLRWVQTPSAGAGSLAHAVPEEWIVTTGTGTYGPPIAEHVIGMILHFTRGLGPAAAAQREGRWDRAGPSPTELGGKRLLILGLGDIGRCLATRAAALGAAGHRRTPPRRRTAAAGGAAGGAARRGRPLAARGGLRRRPRCRAPSTPAGCSVRSGWGG